MAVTKLEKMINPEVMSEMISAKVEKKVAIIPFAKMDTTLQGRAGNTITKEQFNKMGYKERLKLYNEDKELYEKLQNEK